MWWQLACCLCRGDAMSLPCIFVCICGQAHADVNSPTLYDGRTPLMLAAIGGYTALAQYLVGKGATVKAVDMVRDGVEYALWL